MMHTVAFDIVILWLVAIVLFFMFMMAGACTPGGGKWVVLNCSTLVIILLGAIAVTIGQLIGWIGVW